MRISVVIPVHDRRALVGRALRSVLGQLLPPLEIIVVDDGSSDGTADAVREEFPAVTVLGTDATRGVSHARNRGIDHASGEWIAFLDSDDEWLPDKLQRQVECLSRSHEVPLVHGEEIWIRNGVRVNQGRRHRKRGGWIFDDCLPLCVISPSAAMVRRDVLIELGGFDESLPACEDYDLWLRICCRWPMAFVEEPIIVKYGGHRDQLSRRHWGMDRFRVAALERLLDSAPLSPAQRFAVLETLVVKLEILACGAAKRGRGPDARRWRQRQSIAGAELANLAGRT